MRLPNKGNRILNVELAAYWAKKYLTFFRSIRGYYKLPHR